MKKTITILFLLLSPSCNASDNLLQICFDGEKVKYQNCKETQPLIWPKSSLPLKYYIDSALSEYEDSIDAAAKLWNGETCKLLDRTYDASKADIDIIFNSYFNGYADGSLANVSHYGYGLIITDAVMRFNEVTDLHTMMHWATHEFGHIIGLGHDCCSIMRPSLPEHIDGIQRPLPADADIKLIKNLYCR